MLFPARFHLIAAAALLLLAAPLAGCKPKIGDDCSLSTDCSAQGDRLCDTTMTGGYCTVFNCEPGRCPSEASCVGFQEGADNNPVCSDSQRWTRFSRTFCMRTCESDDDCRGGYVCVGGSDLKSRYRAAIVDGDTSVRICIAETSVVPPVSSGAPAVCDPRITPPYDVPYYEGGDSGGSGAGGSAGAAGAAGGPGAAAGSTGVGGAAGGAAGGGVGGTAGAGGA